MLTFLSFGSGSCGNCYYLGNETDAILIDAGIGIRRLKKNMMEYGIKIGLIRGLIITHDHADHIKSAGIMSNDYGMQVYATQLVFDGLNRSYMIKNKVGDSHANVITAGTPFDIGNFHITPFSLPHDASENVGYKIEIDGEVFTIMTDVGDITDNVNRYIAETNHLVIEANYDPEMLRVGRYPEMLKDRICSGTGHLANKQTGEALAQNFHEHLKNVWLCHLSEENNHPELARKTIETILGSYGILAGKDFMLEVLRRRIPTGPYSI